MEARRDRNDWFAVAAYALRAPLVGIPLGLVAAYLPFFYVSFMRGRRLIKFEEQFPEAIDLLARALRAGHAFTAEIDPVRDAARHALIASLATGIVSGTVFEQGIAFSPSDSAYAAANASRASWR